jgi:hypothetical protein
MTRYVWHAGEWLPAPARQPRVPVFPGIIRDHMEPAQHPCTGERFESKSAFRAVTRAHGCVELGNDAPVTPPQFQVDRRELREDIATAMQMVEQGYQPPPAEQSASDARVYTP